MKPHLVLARILRILGRAPYGMADAGEGTAARPGGADPPARQRGQARRYRGRPLPPPDRSR